MRQSYTHIEENMQQQKRALHDTRQLLRNIAALAKDGTKDGLLKYEWQESTQGPPRKYYALTEDGEDALQQLDASWNELAKTVNILHENNPY